MVLTFLDEHAMIAYCDDCLRKILHISRSRMNERNVTAIAADLGLSRKPGKCSVCGVARLVNQAARL
jgi:hypothetical protein